jgi:hypothetical protein
MSLVNVKIARIANLRGFAAKRRSGGTRQGRDPKSSINQRVMERRVARLLKEMRQAFAPPAHRVAQQG